MAFCTSVVTLFLLVGVSQPVKAEEIPIKQATEQGATISEDVDTATNVSPDMSTEFFMYIPPEPVYEVPKMGDDGFDIVQMIYGAFGIGACYLGVQFYADKRRQ